MNHSAKNTFFILLAIVTLIVLSFFFHFRIDLTSDKRFSISPQTKSLMKSVHDKVLVKLYLSGDLNPGFLRLKNSTVDILNELNAYTNSKIEVQQINPSSAETKQEREQAYLNLEARGITGTTVYEKDKEGKSIQNIVFPWAEISINGKTIPVNLLKNDRSLSGEENLNVSIENLEFELTDAIRRLVKKEVEKIAFLEGHGELSEIETYEASKSLNRYFQIDRGVIGSDPTILDAYKAVIIAKPTEAFSEKDKFVLDQYLMKGGTILWLVDGVRISLQNLSESGSTPAMPLDLNLNDQFFRYGFRVNPVILEDVQSKLMPVNIAPKGEKPQFQPTPWIFSPLLLTSSEHPVTKNLPPIMANFASMVESVGDERNILKKIILASSKNTHITQTPAQINLGAMPDLKDFNYFNQVNVPVGVILEGEFQSVFANRMPPQELSATPQVMKTSRKTRQLIIADGDVIRNEVAHTGDSISTVPLGFDRYTNQQFGNNDLITNAVLYLTDKDGWMDLLDRNIPLRLLNKNKATTQRTKIQIFNILLPLLVLALFGIVFQWRRRKKYQS